MGWHYSSGVIPMTRIKREIILTPEERRELEVFTNSGVRSIKPYKRTEMIFAFDISAGRTPDKKAILAGRFGISLRTV
jgi:hypothetical protein